MPFLPKVGWNAEIAQFSQIANAIASSFDVDYILKITCQACVEMVGAEHCGLAIFDDSLEGGTVRAEYPEGLGTIGLPVTIRGIPAAERLVRDRVAVFSSDVANDRDFAETGKRAAQFGIRSMALIPICGNERVLGSFSLDSLSEERTFAIEQLDLCNLLATHVAIALEKARLYQQARTKADQLEALRQTTLSITSHLNKNSLITELITQAVRLLGARNGGVYEYSAKHSRLTVIADLQHPEHIGNTLELGEGLAGELIRSGDRVRVLGDYSNWEGRAAIYNDGRAFGSVVEALMCWQDQVIGVLYVDDFVGRLFTDDDAQLLSCFADQAAIAIWNAGLHNNIRSLYSSTRSLVGEQHPDAILQQFLERLPDLTGADDVTLVLLKPGRPPALLAPKSLTPDPGSLSIRDHGISMQVMSSGQPYAIADVRAVQTLVNPNLLAKGWQAAICLPLMLSGTPIGVAWCHYNRPHHFTDEEITLLSVHANHAAIAYSNSDRMLKLESLQRAMHEMSSAFEVSTACQLIVDWARIVLVADSAAVWPYDERLARFLVREVATSGLPSNSTSQLLQHGEPIPGRTAFTVLQSDYVAVSTVTDREKYSFLTQPVAEILLSIGVRSFQGIALKAGGESLGVLYVNFSYTNEFSEEDERRLKTFAAYASLCLKKTKLVVQRDDLVRAIEAVAGVNVIKGLKETLSSVTDGMKDAIGCDAIVLYPYNARTNKLTQPPIMRGVKHEAPVAFGEIVPKTSIVWRMLTQERPYQAASIKDDTLFAHTEFPRREGLKSCISIPLRAASVPVGVMFVNFREPHIFASEEVRWMELFGNHAALAIHQAQIIDELAESIAERERLNEFSKVLLAADSLDVILSHVAGFAAETIHTDFSSVILPDEDGKNLVLAAGYGWNQELVGTSTLPPGRLSQAGLTMLERRSIASEDVTRDRRFADAEFGRRHGLCSGLSVPMLSGEQVLGVLLVHTRKPRTFAFEDISRLELIAGQTAVILSGVQRFHALERRTAHLQGLYKALASITQTPIIEQNEVLREVLRQAVQSITPAQVLRKALGTIQVGDRDTGKWNFEAFYSPASATTVPGRLNQNEGPCTITGEWQPVGISARVVRTKRPELVADVSKDPDYYPFDPDTCSEIAVPIVGPDSSVIAVLNLESDRIAAFDSQDVRNLTAFADLARMSFERMVLYKSLHAANQELREKDLRRSELFEVIHHELRTPLASLRVAIEALLNGNFGRVSVKQREPLEMALGRVNEESHLVEELLDVARIEEGVVDLKLELMDVASLIQETVQSFSLIAEASGVSLTASLPTSERLAAYVDRMRLRSVLNNLVANALKFTPTGGAVMVLGEHYEDGIRISVSDTGIGIASRDLGQIFDRHYQSDKLRSRHNGLGLGLYIVRTYVQAHGGDLVVQTEEGRGSVFELKIPT